MLRLYITRHGETQWNIEKKMQGWQDSPLTAKGIQNALWLSERMELVDIDVIYASPSGRAQHTAELIRGNKPTQIVFDPNLKEINMGEWEGHNVSAIKEQDQASFHAFWNEPASYKPSGGESFPELIERVGTALKEIEAKHSSGNVLIVTHSVVIKALFMIFKDTEIEHFWAPPYIEDTSLTIVEVDDTGYRVSLEGCTVHKENNDERLKL
ncbi:MULTISPECIES: histidine phosphatase family protein [unclassified Planococcus (in: firmicutes)]|uniref:histidine phosphatase family protein n=1 Tax=unclassified Planococcus (in: firmicutes) TaxID=2662419 RepID=UPI000C33E9A7|nr:MULTISPECIES: histidine phosphatase family protein [unclassified Planococcus (in: firmicutes)]AUD15012.1 histidine phosphatase family protein [Planococcus sp. MB-3u-03]PKG47049.1 histidine phosphatase family protein [Planococcus sp. Urea-trap-24]PKG87822.1 histidine phosphatase family protein [Planococcus sp. Urea-3u-39]PKH35480.1 histidine phosphatase family protein [Planococcus sp. MB-3u-09]